jgi:hypothetical protein
MPYYALISRGGLVKRGSVPGIIGVLEWPDAFMLIGQANCFTWDADGVAMWRVIVHGQELPGEFVIIDREFRAVA